MPQLAQRIRAKYPGAYDDIDDATLEKQVLAKHPEYADLAQPEPQKPAPKASMVDMALMDNPALPPLFRGGQAVLRLAKRNPATTGAMVAGAAAAPFTGGMSVIPAMAISGGAGALGAGAGQLVSGQKPDVATMAKEGAAMAGGEGLGRGAVALLSKAAPILGKAVLRASPTLQREFPNLVETFLKERIPVGQSAQAGERMTESAGTARQMAAEADAAGAAPVGPRDIVKEFRGVRDEIANRAANARPGAGGEMQEIVTRAKGLRLAGPQSVARNQVLKQSAQTDASNAFRAAERGTPINDVTAKLDKAVAIGRQKAAEARVPGIADVNKRTQNLMGLEGALETAERKSASPLGFNPVNWGTAMAPGLGSRAAFTADSLTRAPIPGALRTLLALLAGEDPNSPH